VTLTCRLAELMTWLGAQLARVRDKSAALVRDAASGDAAGSRGGGAAGGEHDSALVSSCLDRLLVHLADMTTDDRLHFVHAECDACLRALAPSDGASLSYQCMRP